MLKRLSFNMKTVGRLDEVNIETLSHGMTSSGVYFRFRNAILILYATWMRRRPNQK